MRHLLKSYPINRRTPLSSTPLCVDQCSIRRTQTLMRVTLIVQFKYLNKSVKVWTKSGKNQEVFESKWNFFLFLDRTKKVQTRSSYQILILTCSNDEPGQVESASSDVGPGVLAEVCVQQAQLTDVERHVLHPPVRWHHFAEQVQVVQDGQVLEKDGTEIAGFECLICHQISNLSTEIQ